MKKNIKLMAMTAILWLFNINFIFAKSKDGSHVKQILWVGIILSIIVDILFELKRRKKNK